MIWLKNIQDCPPAEFYIKQDGKTFGPSPLIGKVASDIADYRKGNGLPRLTERECIEDVIVYTVQRLVASLGSRNEWCYETDLEISQLLPIGPIKGCSGCGAKIS